VDHYARVLRDTYAARLARALTLAISPPSSPPPTGLLSMNPEIKPGLVQATRELLALRRRSSPTEADLGRAMDAFMDALRTEGDAGQLRSALDEDADALLLPPELKSALYVRLLAMDGRRPATLREYAWHLRFWGPDRDDEAEALMVEAERSDSQR
jgi:hypothetical protein